MRMRRRMPRRPAIAALGLGAALALSAGVALGAPAGDLDPAFDGDGMRVLATAGIVGHDVAVQPDGKIVVAGSSLNGSPAQYDGFMVWRLNPDGSLDETFDGDGTASVNFDGADYPRAVALQPDGKIVVAGQTRVSASDDDMAVARFTPRGELDATFDPGGPDGDGKKVFEDDTHQAATAVVVQPDGRIVVAGWGLIPNGNGAQDYAITRLTQTGSVDGTTFELDGPEGLGIVNAAALAPDGELVVAGGNTVARFGLDGSLDKTLAGTGKATLGPGGPTDVQAVLVDPDGRIVVAGTGGDTDPRMVVARLTRAGTLDGAFGEGGAAKADFEGQDIAAAVARQPDGKLLVAGTTTAGYDFAVARFDASGVLDASFGSGGKTTIGFDDLAIATGAVLQPDGKLVVAGATVVDVTATDPHVAVARLLADPLPGRAGGGPAADTTAPALSRVRLTRKRFGVGRAATPRAARTPRGTLLRFQSSEAATLTIRFDRLRGRRARRAGVLTRRIKAGPGRVALSGRIGKRRMRLGRYRLTLQARDAAGNRSKVVRRQLTILGR